MIYVFLFLGGGGRGGGKGEERQSFVKTGIPQISLPPPHGLDRKIYIYNVIYKLSKKINFKSLIFEKFSNSTTPFGGGWVLGLLMEGGS